MRRLTSTAEAHRGAGYKDSPSSTHHFIVGETLKGIRRTIGIAQVGQSPRLTRDIQRIVRACPGTLAGLRDKALVLVGFAGAFRRSELARIQVSDLTFNSNGVVIELRVSKTDQGRAGRKVGLLFGKNQSTCSVRALRAWLKTARIRKGPVFRRVDRSGHPSRRRGLNKDSVGKLLKRAAARARMKTGSLGGHSLPAGCVTQAAMNGVQEAVIQRQTAYKTVSMLRRTGIRGDGEIRLYR